MPLSDHDRKLLKRACRRDRSAFADFYLRFQSTVYLEILRIVRVKVEADDLTSETFLRAWNAIDRYEDRGYSLEAWLKVIARNLALGHLKRRSREAPFIFDPDTSIDSASQPAELTEVALDSEAIRESLALLPEIQRRVLTMRFYEDLPFSQIADIVGKREGTIRVIQYRALKSLRALFERRSILRGRNLEARVPRVVR